MYRREFLQNAGAISMGLGLSELHEQWAYAKGAAKKRVLFFSKSSGFEHPVISEKTAKMSLAGQTLTDLGARHGFEVVCTKDGSIFTRDNIAKYDAFFFYTTGDLTQAGNDKHPPMSPEGKAAFLDAISKGKGFLGAHSATDTFHYMPDETKDRYASHGDRVDPYIAMIGGEFIHHGAQQSAVMKVIDPKFPGFKGLKDFSLHEEWYSLKDFSPNLHVLLVQETNGMKGTFYERGSYPGTWARMHGKGRVFYTSMGHNKEVWESERYQNMLVGAIAWATKLVTVDVSPNLEKAAPKHRDLPPIPPPVLPK